MKATAKYNDEGEPYRLEVSERHGHSVSFAIRGSEAVAQRAQQPDGEPEVYLDRVNRFMEYVETLPFVESVSLAEPEVLE